MFKTFSHEIPFMKYRKPLYLLSAVLMVLAVVGLFVRGLSFGIEFSGGTSIDFQNTGSITTEQMRSALDEAGEGDAIVQTSVVEGSQGFLVRTATTDPHAATTAALTAAQKLGLSEDSFQVTTIGPDWGANVTKSSVIAFLVAIGCIIVYISVRFEFKMSLTAVASLIHDLLIIVGVYAWTQFEITPNVIAALLTIMGYSLYDTVVVFHRINENAKANVEAATNGMDTKHRTFMQISNFSINQVFIRTLNTSLTSLVPVICMLIFGGATLKDFAFAMTIGLILGSYSSIGISTPLFAAWKTTEDKWKKLEARFGEKIQAAEGKGSYGAVSYNG